MGGFYLLSEKGQPVVAQLSWSHYCELLSIKDFICYKKNCTTGATIALSIVYDTINLEIITITWLFKKVNHWLTN